MSDVARQLNESAMKRQAQSKAHHNQQVSKLKDDVPVSEPVTLSVKPLAYEEALKLANGNEIVAIYGDSVVVKVNPWRQSHADLLEHLEDWVSQHGCDCGHPACKGCERTREARDVIRKAKGVTG